MDRQAGGVRAEIAGGPGLEGLDARKEGRVALDLPRVRYGIQQFLRHHHIGGRALDVD